MHIRLKIIYLAKRLAFLVALGIVVTIVIDLKDGRELSFTKLGFGAFLGMWIFLKDEIAGAEEALEEATVDNFDLIQSEDEDYRL